MKPLAVDLCCGLGGWAHGLISEGWEVLGFDIEAHEYGGDKYPGRLVIQDIRTLVGQQFRGKASLIVASPPCQFFSYTAMPWKRAKELAKAVRADPVKLEKELELFNACVRLGREAECPIIIENVRGIQPWVGRSRWNFGSFHLFGDIPALMPTVSKHVKAPGFRFDGSGKSFQTACVDGVKGSDGYERNHPAAFGWKKPGTSSHSNARKAASAAIAKIPFALSSHIAKVFKPRLNP